MRHADGGGLWFTLSDGTPAIFKSVVHRRLTDVFAVMFKATGISYEKVYLQLYINPSSTFRAMEEAIQRTRAKLVQSLPTTGE